MLRRRKRSLRRRRRPSSHHHQLLLRTSQVELLLEQFGVQDDAQRHRTASTIIKQLGEGGRISHNDLAVALLQLRPQDAATGLIAEAMEAVERGDEGGDDGDTDDDTTRAMRRGAASATQPSPKLQELRRLLAVTGTGGAGSMDLAARLAPQSRAPNAADDSGTRAALSSSPPGLQKRASSYKPRSRTELSMLGDRKQDEWDELARHGSSRNSTALDGMQVFMTSDEGGYGADSTRKTDPLVMRLTQQVEELRQEVVVLTHTNSGLQTTLELKSAEFKQELMVQQEDMQTELETMETELKNFEAQASASKQQLIRVEKYWDDAKVENEALRSEIAQLQQELGTMRQNASSDQLPKQYEDLKHEHEQLAQAYSELCAQIQQDDRTEKQLQSAVEKQQFIFDQELLHAREVIRKLEAENSQLKVAAEEAAVYRESYEELRSKMLGSSPAGKSPQPTSPLTTTTSLHQELSMATSPASADVSGVDDDRAAESDSFRPVSSLAEEIMLAGSNIGAAPPPPAHTSGNKHAALQEKIQQLQHTICGHEMALEQEKSTTSQLREEVATLQGRLTKKQQQLQDRKRLVDDQAAVIDKLKAPLLDMTSAMQQMQSKKQQLGQELLEARHKVSALEAQTRDIETALNQWRRGAYRTPTTSSSDACKRSSAGDDGDRQEPTPLRSEYERIVAKYKAAARQIEEIVVVISHYVGRRSEFVAEFSDASPAQLLSRPRSGHAGDKLGLVQGKLRDLDNIYEACLLALRKKEESLHHTVASREKELRRKDEELRQTKTLLTSAERRLERSNDLLQSFASSSPSPRRPGASAEFFSTPPTLASTTPRHNSPATKRGTPTSGGDNQRRNFSYVRAVGQKGNDISGTPARHQRPTSPLGALHESPQAVTPNLHNNGHARGSSRLPLAQDGGADPGCTQESAYKAAAATGESQVRAGKGQPRSMPESKRTSIEPPSGGAHVARRSEPHRSIAQHVHVPTDSAASVNSPTAQWHTRTEEKAVVSSVADADGTTDDEHHVRRGGDSSAASPTRSSLRRKRRQGSTRMSCRRRQDLHRVAMGESALEAVRQTSRAASHPSLQPAQAHHPASMDIRDKTRAGSSPTTTTTTTAAAPRRVAAQQSPPSPGTRDSRYDTSPARSRKSTGQSHRLPVRKPHPKNERELQRRHQQQQQQQQQQPQREQREREGQKRDHSVGTTTTVAGKSSAHTSRAQNSSTQSPPSYDTVAGTRQEHNQSGDPVCDTNHTRKAAPTHATRPHAAAMPASKPPLQVTQKAATRRRANIAEAQHNTVL